MSSDRDPSKRDIEHGINELSGPDPEWAELWGRFVEGEYPEDPAERHPAINRWLEAAMDEHGNVYGGFSAPEWANEVREEDLPPEQRPTYDDGETGAEP